MHPSHPSCRFPWPPTPSTQVAVSVRQVTVFPWCILFRAAPRSFQVERADPLHCQCGLQSLAVLSGPKKKVGVEVNGKRKNFVFPFCKILKWETKKKTPLDWGPMFVFFIYILYFCTYWYTAVLFLYRGFGWQGVGLLNYTCNFYFIFGNSPVDFCQWNPDVFCSSLGGVVGGVEQDWAVSSPRGTNGEIFTKKVKKLLQKNLNK